MPKPMFPELEKLDVRALIGLKIVKVISSFQDSIRTFECIGENGEVHEIQFAPRDESCILVKLDGEVIAHIDTERW